MSQPLHFYIVDDHAPVVEVLQRLLETAGHRVTATASSKEALKDIPGAKPDCVLVDIMMPELDGMELCAKLREDSELDDMRIVMVTAKPFSYDRQRARDVGADGYMTKPIEAQTFVKELEDIVADRVTLSFWGVRGTLPVPGERSVRHGGNTPCVSLSFQDGQLFIFDAGTGIKELARHLETTNGSRLSGKLFITHPHWDHIHGFPFFTPLYKPGNEFEILGSSHGSLGMKDLIAGQMGGVYFPITIRELGASVTYRDLREETVEIGHASVKTMLLSHPGNCLGYRVDYRGRSFCYVTDNELFPEDRPEHDADYVEKLVEFVAGADILVTDCTYTDDEYPDKLGWGHSAVTPVAELAANAKVKKLCLFHHDPDQDDDDIDRKLDLVRGALSSLGSNVECTAPCEGDRIRF